MGFRSASLDEPENPSSHSVNQLRCKDLRPGDLLLKFNAGSKTNKMIAFGQSAAGQLNAAVVHAGVMMSYFAIRDGKVSPSTLASMLQSSGAFKEAGYMMPGER
jgi:hypothetical protein